MKYVEEFRELKSVNNLVNKIRNTVTQKWNIMEICGGQTHTIMKYNIEEFLPDSITLLHGPGCPVCVTPLEMIDKAIAIAERNDVILASFGDMMRVPGSKHDLLSVKANGGDVRMVYSPLDAVKLAKDNPGKKVVFFAVGFETTAPANAMSVLEAKRLKINNYSILCSHVLVPPAIDALLSDKNSKINAFLAAGHVCTVMGINEYFPLAQKFKVPIVVTGFEPVDILSGIYSAVKQLESKTFSVENAYSRVVSKDGNLPAQNIIKTVFEITDRKWRGIGTIPLSGYKLKKDFIDYDAENIFDVGFIEQQESPLCISGQILQGFKKPTECPAFGSLCNPEHPLGAPMVSAEGACAAYYSYKKLRTIAN